MDLSEDSDPETATRKPETPESRESRESRRSRDRDGRSSSSRHQEDYYRDRDRRDRHDRREKREREYRRYGNSSSRSSSRDRRRSRSHSRDRDRKYATQNKRFQPKNQQNPPEKTDYQQQKPVIPARVVEGNPQNAPPGNLNIPTNTTTEASRFFMPGITGRFRDQIEKRKQLWQKKDVAATSSSTVKPVQNPSNGQSKKVWETTTFAQDTDGKVANKFKRLMGIKAGSGASEGPTDVLKRQEEMFSSMEQQYEVARTATHTMRGVGLGFGSFQR